MLTHYPPTPFMKNKRLVLSILLIVLVAGGAIAGTYAFFTAQRTASTNRFTAGTLDLNVTSNSVANEPFVIDNVGTNGDISGEKTYIVKNTGSLPGRLYLRLQNVNNEENGCNDQESAVEPNCAADNIGEMGNVIAMNVDLDGTQVATTNLATANQAALGTQWSALAPIILQPNEQRTVRVHWAAGENDYDNSIQSDSVAFDMNFRLIQQVNQQVAN